ARLVQDERRIDRAIGLVAPVEEGELAEAGALDPLEKLLGDNLIGVHVRPVERRDEARFTYEWSHRLSALPDTDIDEVAGNRGGGGHLRADQVSTATLPLPSLEVAVRG